MYTPFAKPNVNRAHKHRHERTQNAATTSDWNMKSICFALFLLWRHINFSFNKSFPIEFRTRWFLFISFVLPILPLVSARARSLSFSLFLILCVWHVLAFYLDWKRSEWKKIDEKKNQFFAKQKNLCLFFVLLLFIHWICRSAIIYWQMDWFIENVILPKASQNLRCGHSIHAARYCWTNYREKKSQFSFFFSGFNLAQSVRRGLLIIFWQVFSSHVPYSPCTCTYEHGNHNGSQWTDKARWNINQFGQEIETLYLHIFCFGFGLSFHVWCEVRTYSAYRHVMEFHHNFCSPLFHRLLLCQLFACGSGTHKNAHLLACQLYVCKIIPRCWRRRCDLTFLVFICSQATVWWAEYVIDCFCKSFQIWSNFWFLTNFGNATDETANGMMWCWLWCKLQIHIFDVQLNARCG